MIGQASIFNTFLKRGQILRQLSEIKCIAFFHVRDAAMLTERSCQPLNSLMSKRRISVGLVHLSFQ